MNHWRLPYPPWGTRGGLDRVQDWHLITYRRLHLAVPLRRRLPLGLEPFGGGAYWCLSRRAIDFVHGFVHANPEVVRFFNRVLIPDEIFFQTILMNSPIRDEIENDNLRYLDWSRQPAPAVLQTSDLDAMTSSGKLFARKFDVTVCAAVLEALDRKLDRGVNER